MQLAGFESYRPTTENQKLKHLLFILAVIRCHLNYLTIQAQQPIGQNSRSSPLLPARD